MGDGCLSGGLTVVDFDGTYIAGNSLHIYLRMAFMYHLRGLRLKRAFRIAMALAMRKAGMLSHVAMKRKALAAAGTPESLLSGFSKKIKHMVRPDVADFISFRKSCGDVILLATAAPGFYVRRVWPGEYFVATDYGRGVPRRGKTRSRAPFHRSAQPAHRLCSYRPPRRCPAHALQCRGRRNQRSCGA